MSVFAIPSAVSSYTWRCHYYFMSCSEESWTALMVFHCCSRQQSFRVVLMGVITFANTLHYLTHSQVSAYACWPVFSFLWSKPHLAPAADFWNMRDSWTEHKNPKQEFPWTQFVWSTFCHLWLHLWPLCMLVCMFMNISQIKHHPFSLV